MENKYSSLFILKEYKGFEGHLPWEEQLIKIISTTKTH